MSGIRWDELIKALKESINQIAIANKNNKVTIIRYDHNA